jgi:hypothetical protein
MKLNDNAWRVLHAITAAIFIGAIAVGIYGIATDCPNTAGYVSCAAMK